METCKDKQEHQETNVKNLIARYNQGLSSSLTPETKKDEGLKPTQIAIRECMLRDRAHLLERNNAVSVLKK
jgi:hypothetical protein